MDRDFIWKGDYGDRSHLVKVVGNLLDEQDVISLQMVSAFVNSVPYNLEFYIAISYSNPKENHINDMMEALKKAGLEYRADITLKQLNIEIGNRRFQLATFFDKKDFSERFPTLFSFKERDELITLGYNCMVPITELSPIFLSHQSNNKNEIEEIIPFLNAAGLPVWFDKLSIDYGESITKSIQQGIKKSFAVILWITKDFLNSNWCDTELQSFLNKYCSKKDVLIIPVVDEDVDMEKIDDIFLSNLKYFKRNEHSIEDIAIEILPSLKKFYEKNKDSI
ncbi:TIR domain [Clostridioides difficile]|uniref:toll/interleukin-1 receptor domain-containing protein n=1 Tax=Clostridioides difficile TaxID=1496 RepID=UPI000D1FA2B3|nr:toll/interleukin-1 receptor domain-containing protein [Clostridioides difficile]UWD41395.1 toll/interleukin-1 receptor domain-containing protein [Clostridioides difficile]UWD45039.1 toll/interleukin-1 receptor domain-containing protein [Clostridioides difficile]VFF92662.1 TIR domain [Clostridioides difficile]VIF75985.1 TIR domain [Clostridioides difficile]HBE9436766.1 toll/interleukin-1 receptor domain-containing protein [Clostridioides difficile]